MDAGPGLKRAAAVGAFLSGAAARRRPSAAAAQSMPRDDEAAQRLDAVLDAAGLGVFDVDAGLRIVWSSRAAWPGSDGVAPLGRTPVQLLGDDGAGRHWLEAAAQVAGGAAPSARVGVMLPSAGGAAPHRLEHLITPRRDADGHVVGLRVVVDGGETDERRAGDGLVTDALLSSLSHELRTPLNAILGWAHVLDRAGAAIDDALLHRAVDAIARNVRAQSALVDELLDLGRLAAGTLRLALDDCDAAQLLREASDALEPLARARWVGVDRGGIVAGTLRCRADAARLTQAFHQVIDNALRHAPLDSTVRIAARRDDAAARIVIDIVDDGDGISPERLPHIFDGLRRGHDDAVAPRHGGLGVGLALVRGIVELHGGQVSVASDGPGRGTAVHIELPAAADGASTAELAPRGPADGRDEAANTAATKAAPAAGPLAWRRILLVEDDADSLEVTSMMLREHGAIVRAYDNAEQALAAAEHGSFDLIVSDLGMPGMDGLEFMRRLRAAAGSEVAAIALTAYAGDEPRRQALDAGFRRVETKPISAARLLAVVTQELAAPGSAA